MKSLFCLMVTLWLSGSAVAGVTPARSRLIFNENSNEQSLMLVNTNAWPVLVQTWIDDGQGSPDARAIPFVSVPPVFRLESQSIRGLRVIYNRTAALPRDRESLYWLNIYEIPPEKRSDSPDNSVLVTMNTQLKIFWRPAGINIKPEQAITEVTCQRSGVKQIRCHNPSPVHLSVIALQVSRPSATATALDADLLMTPFGDKVIHLDREIPGQFRVTFRYVNDEGEQLTAQLAGQ